MREKRSHARKQVDLETQVTPHGASAFSGVLRDLGVGGAFIESAQEVPYDSALTLTLAVPGEATPLQLPGVARWSKPGGFGVQFGLLGARETHAIARLIKP
jgi:hypothetical protein